MSPDLPILNWCAIDDLHSGLGRMAFNLAKAVRRNKLRWVPTRTSSDFTPSQQEYWTSPLRVGKRSLVIDGISELERCVKDGDLVFTMWETTRLPEAVVAAINRAACCIVPSDWVLQSFMESGVTAPLRKVPLGVDPTIFNPGGKSKRNARFRFGSCCRFCCDGNPRKNLTAVVRAFSLAFPNQEPVDLVFKGYDTGVPSFADGRITLVNDFWEDDFKLAEWYKTLDACINVASAGGWELHLQETMAVGVVPISVHYSGEREFFDESCGFVVKHKIVRPSWNVYSLGEWCEPDIDDLASQFRKAYGCQNIGELSASAARSAARFTWERAAAELEDVIDEFCK